MKNGTSRSWHGWIDNAKACAYLLPVIAVALVYIGHNETRGSLSLAEAKVNLCIRVTPQTQCALEQLATVVQVPGSSPEVAMLDLKGRLQLSTSLDTFLVAFLVLVCGAAFVVARCRRRQLNHRQWLLAGVVVAVSVFVSSVFHTRQMSLLLNSFDVLVTNTMPKTELGLLGADHLVGALAMISSALLAATFAIIIEGLPAYSAAPRDEVTQQQLLDDMKTRCAALRATLITGAAVLASGIIFIHALQNWALAFVDKPELLRGAADQWAVSQGSYWTLILTAAYVPCAIVLRRAAHDIAKARMNPTKEDETETTWLENHDLSVSMKGQLLQIVMLLAPWLTGGPLPDLAKLIGAHA